MTLKCVSGYEDTQTGFFFLKKVLISEDMLDFYILCLYANGSFCFYEASWSARCLNYLGDPSPCDKISVEFSAMEH